MPPAEVLVAENQQLRQEIVILKEQIAWLMQQLFGTGKSEKLDTAQLRLQLDELQTRLEASEAQTVTYERRARRVGQHETPAERFKDLPVEETVMIEPEEVTAEPEAFEKIAEEETFEVDIHPPKLFKRRLVRPKYRKIGDKERPPVVAPAPARRVD